MPLGQVVAFIIFQMSNKFFQIQRFLFVSLYMAIYAIFGYIGLSLVMHK